MAGERASGGGGFDIWLGRAAMLGFVGALGVEITTGKGVLQVGSGLVFYGKKIRELMVDDTDMSMITGFCKGLWWRVECTVKNTVLLIRDCGGMSLIIVMYRIVILLYM